MWSIPAEDLFREMEGHFQRNLSSLVRKHFGSYAHGGLEGKIKCDEFHYCFILSFPLSDTWSLVVLSSTISILAPNLRMSG